MTPALTSAPILLDHVADFYRRYPGEPLTLFTRVQVRAPVPELTLTVRLPVALHPVEYQLRPTSLKFQPTVSQQAGEHYVVWHLARPLRAGMVLEFSMQARVQPTEHDLAVESRAWVTLAPATPAAAVENLSVQIAAQARALNYLPALFAEDELLSRFLMLFDSFWKPLDQQIAGLAHYFDPQLTPPDFLPWLAEWLNLTLDERWPEPKRRRLLQNAATLFRQRGTRAALQTYLEIYTDVRPQIHEHGGSNFRLGAAAQLGLGLALGTLNQPHAFSVALQLPPLKTGPQPAQMAEAQAARERAIRAIIDAEKPAHTHYTLRIETVASNEEESVYDD